VPLEKTVHPTAAFTAMASTTCASAPKPIRHHVGSRIGCQTEPTAVPGIRAVKTGKFGQIVKLRRKLWSRRRALPSPRYVTNSSRRLPCDHARGYDAFGSKTRHYRAFHPNKGPVHANAARHRILWASSHNRLGTDAHQRLQYKRRANTAIPCPSRPVPRVLKPAIVAQKPDGIKECCQKSEKLVTDGFKR